MSSKQIVPYGLNRPPKKIKLNISIYSAEILFKKSFKLFDKLRNKCSNLLENNLDYSAIRLDENFDAYNPYIKVTYGDVTVNIIKLVSIKYSCKINLFRRKKPADLKQQIFRIGMRHLPLQ